MAGAVGQSIYTLFLVIYGNYGYTVIIYSGWEVRSWSQKYRWGG